MPAAVDPDRIEGFVEFISDLRRLAVASDEEAAMARVSEFFRTCKPRKRVIVASTRLAEIPEIPVRVTNALESRGYLTVGSVIRARDADLLAIRNFNKVSLDLVRKAAVPTKIRG